MIEGVSVKRLKVIPDERGMLMEMMRSDDEVFERFGQIYMTTAYPGVVKGWHYHKVQNDNFVAIRGMMKVVLYDNRKDSPTFGDINEFFMGEHNPILLHRSEEHTSELQSHSFISYAVFCLKKKNTPS